jgi:hypothetical protein
MPSNTSLTCPSWCSGDHQGQDQPSDRYHQSVHTLVPVVVPARPPEESRVGDEQPGAEVTEFSVQASQSVRGERTIWVAIAGEQQYIDVTVESAARLYDALGQLLDQLRLP